jgi:hypothetical protein
MPTAFIQWFGTSSGSPLSVAKLLTRLSHFLGCEETSQ